MASYTSESDVAQDTAPRGPSVGTDNNVEYGDASKMGKKEGFMDKVKDKLLPGIKGPDTGAAAKEHATKHAASFETDQLQARHGQANESLNRE